MNDSKVTIYDIARRLNISASTVSRALQNHPRISEQTRNLVQQTARELNFRPNELASNLRKGKSKSIGVIVPRINRVFFSTVISGIEEVAYKSNYQVIIAQSHELVERENECITTFLSNRVDGIIASISNQTVDPAPFQHVFESHTPLVFFDRTLKDIATSNVILDDFQGAFKAVEHLIMQGCRRIVHLAGPTIIGIYAERKRGYVEALKKYGLEVDESLIWSVELTEKGGFDAASWLAQLNPMPDAVFAAGDFAAVGIMKSLKDAGIAVPDQVAVAGFGNEPFTTLVDPSLTSVNQHPFEMGRLAASMLLEQLADRVHFQPRISLLQPTLEIRRSTLRKIDK